MHLRLCLLLAVVAVLMQACGKSESPAEEMFRRGMELKSADLYQDALQVFRKAIDVDPGYENAYLHIALIYDDYLQDKVEAAKWYEQYLEVATNEQQKERVSRWLKEAQALAAQQVVATTADASAPTLPAAARQAIDTRLEEQRARLEREFKAKEQVLAGRYENQLDDLKDELLTVKRAHDDLNDKLGEMTSLRDSLQRRLADSSSTEQLKQLLDSPEYSGSDAELKARLAERNGQIEKLKTQLSQQSGFSQEKEELLVKLRQQVAATEHGQRNQAAAEELRTRVAELEAQNRQLATRLSDAMKAAEDADVSVAVSPTDEEFTRLRAQVEQLESERTRILADKQQAENALADLQTRTDAVIADMAASSGEDVATENRRLRLQIAKITSQFQDADAQRVTAAERAQELEQEIEAMRNLPPAAQPAVGGEFSDLSQEIVNMQETIEGQKKLLAQQDTQIADLTQRTLELQRTATQPAPAPEQPLIEDLNRQLAEKDQQISQRDTRLQEYKTAYDNAVARIQVLQGDRPSPGRVFPSDTSDTREMAAADATVYPAPATPVTQPATVSAPSTATLPGEGMTAPPPRQPSARDYSRVFYPESPPRTEQPAYAVTTPAAPSYSPRRTTGRQPRAYRVRSGDTLSGIARRVYGDRNKWNVIYAANRDILPRADSLRIGQVLYIPPQ
jgi:nucleoid-associated protein YgaU